MNIRRVSVIRDSFASRTGRGVRVAIIDSGVNPAHPHVAGVAGGTRIASSAEPQPTDYLDYLGHGTAVAGAIREKAPDAELFAIKVFDRALTTNIEIIVKAFAWCLDNQMDVINLSLGTINPDHRAVIEGAVALATANGAVLVAAREMADKPSLPGCLPSVVGVVADWQCARERYRTGGSNDDPVFIASPYPRDIPGVPPERNMNGISFAVANMSGFVARAKEYAPRASVVDIKRLLIEESKSE